MQTFSVFTNIPKLVRQYAVFQRVFPPGCLLLSHQENLFNIKQLIEKPVFSWFTVILFHLQLMHLLISFLPFAVFLKLMYRRINLSI